MTPLAQKILNDVGDTNPNASRQIKSCVCFEVSNVVDLILETSQTLKIEDDSQASKIYHGGLLIAPFENFIIEGRGDLGSFIFICRLEHNQIIFQYLEWFDDGNFSQSLAYLQFNREYFQVGKYNNHNSKGAMSLASALIILNAPYGIERESQPVHKGRAKQAKRAGFELLPHHIIKLSKSAPPKDYQGDIGSGTPKAFHFVRSFRRQYKTGKSVVVKAHWRGDPRLGIHRASYEVRH